jgi:ribulose-bisphosphate carboxylase large chain
MPVGRSEGDIRMKKPDGAIVRLMNEDLDDREELIRRAVYEALADLPEPDLSAHIVATYFVAARTMSPARAGKEIAYHMTSGVRSWGPGTLLAGCSGEVVDSIVFDRAERTGIVRVAFPLLMLRHETGDLFTSDILHIIAGAGIFELREHMDAKLVHVAMSEDTLNLFPGPAYGADGVRRLTGLSPEDIAFGTILKPCTGITPVEEAELVGELVREAFFMFIKEDENHLPNDSFAPLRERAVLAMEAVRNARADTGGREVIFAPHITSPPHLLADSVRTALDAGCNGVMLSEYFTGGSFRMVRELTRNNPRPPVIYGHSGGITVRTRHIYREVLDLFARLDGIDMRQTAPLTAGIGLLRPFGLEWRQCERVLGGPLGKHPPVMVTRAGGLDQGNIIPNLIDVTSGAGASQYLFLAGSAINGIKNDTGVYDSSLGAEAMRQAVQIYREGVFPEAADGNVSELKRYAASRGMKALVTALEQRYAG